MRLRPRLIKLGFYIYLREESSPNEFFMGLEERSLSISSILVNLSSTTAFCQLSSSKWILSDYLVRLKAYTKFDVNHKPGRRGIGLHVKVVIQHFGDLGERLLGPLLDCCEGVHGPELDFLLRIGSQDVAFV